MSWQDVVIAVLQFSFLPAMVPSLRGAEKPAFLTCAWTAFGLTAMGVTFLSMAYWLSMAGWEEHNEAFHVRRRLSRPEQAVYWRGCRLPGFSGGAEALQCCAAMASGLHGRVRAAGDSAMTGVLSYEGVSQRLHDTTGWLASSGMPRREKEHLGKQLELASLALGRSKQGARAWEVANAGAYVGLVERALRAYEGRA